MLAKGMDLSPDKTAISEIFFRIFMLHFPFLNLLPQN